MIVGRKTEVEGSVGKRYHAKERLTQAGNPEWYFDESMCRLAPTMMLLIRIMVGKVVNNQQLESILRTTPIRQGEEGWNCISWVKEAFERLQTDQHALGTSVTEWAMIRDRAMSYCQAKKEQHRFDGQGDFELGKAPTYDLIEGIETTP